MNFTTPLKGLGALLSAALLPTLLHADEAATAVAAAPKIDSGNTAWVIISTAMVLLMTPGLALFYGGMVRKKNVLSTMMHSFFMMGLISIQWVLVGYSFSFGAGSSLGGYLGGTGFFGLAGVGAAPHAVLGTTIPQLVFMAYQMMFAVITVALISGAVADRIKFSAFVVFALLYHLRLRPRLPLGVES